MTCVDTATGLLIAFPACCADQQTTKRGLEHLFAAMAGHALEEWVQQLGIEWKFHVPYNPAEAGMVERYKGLLNSGLKLDTNCLWGWSVRLWTVLQHLNEKLQKGAFRLMNMLTHIAASLTQLHVQSKEEY